MTTAMIIISLIMPLEETLPSVTVTSFIYSQMSEELIKDLFSTRPFITVTKLLLITIKNAHDSALLCTELAEVPSKLWREMVKQYALTLGQ